MSKPKVLVFDIETSPIIAHVWSIWEQNVGLNQIQSDWHVMAWAAKWFTGKDGTVYGPHDRMMYMDQRKVKNKEDDSKLLAGIWQLLDQADIIITQNGDSFDVKRLNARFILNGMKPPSSYRSIDTKKIAKRKFGFTSNRLEYMTHKLNKKYKKLKHAKFQGHELWTECLKDNKEAWNEMEQYNKYDVLSLEELYINFQPWDNTVNFNVYSERLENVCKCGSKSVKLNGHSFLSSGKYRRYKCTDCGAESRGRENLLCKEKRASLRIGK